MKIRSEDSSWSLISAEERHRSYPNTFEIPESEIRNGLLPGMAAKLLFDIATEEGGTLVDRGIDRMWVIVLPKSEATANRYHGVLDSDPGIAENLNLRKGDIICFGSEHVCSVDQPPRDFLLEEYGHYFSGHI